MSWDWSQGGQGALGGAMTGAGVGSTFGPWGTAIGAGVGALGGLLGGGMAGNPNAEYQQMLLKLSQGFGGRQAPQAGPAAQAGASGLMGNRAGLIAMLEAQARGEGPSAASLQMREAMDRATASQASAAAGAGGRGVNAGAATRNAMNNTAAIQSQGARDSSILRAQEQLAATQQLGQTVGQGIGQDNQMAQWNAGAQNDMQQANLAATLQALGINTQAQLQALMAAMGGQQGAPFGSSLMAGGASMFPAMMQMNQQRNQAQGSAPQAGPTRPGWMNGPAPIDASSLAAQYGLTLPA